MGKKKVDEVKQVEEVKLVEPVKPKKKRSEKQIQAFNKMRERLAEKKKATAEPKAEKNPSSPIPTKPLQREETVDLQVENEVIEPIKERKEIKNEVLPSIEEEEDFSNFDYNYQPVYNEPVAFKVGNQTYSTQALKSYKNSLQYKRQFRPPIIDKSIFF
jgi:DNA replication protein DnaC